MAVINKNYGRYSQCDAETPLDEAHCPATAYIVCDYTRRNIWDRSIQSRREVLQNG
jgi:hypothetical protein